jgi:hypothetical protein
MTERFMKILPFIRELLATKDVSKTIKKKLTRYRIFKKYYSLHPLIRSFARIFLYLFIPVLLSPIIFIGPEPISLSFRTFFMIVNAFLSYWFLDVGISLVLFILRRSKSVQKLEKKVNWKTHPEAIVLIYAYYFFMLFPYTIPSMLIIFAIITYWVFLR